MVVVSSVTVKAVVSQVLLEQVRQPRQTALTDFGVELDIGCLINAEFPVTAQVGFARHVKRDIGEIDLLQSIVECQSFPTIGRPIYGREVVLPFMTGRNGPKEPFRG